MADVRPTLHAFLEQHFAGVYSIPTTQSIGIEFCPKFSTFWAQFEIALIDFVLKPTTGKKSDKLNEVLDEFFASRPDFLLRGCLVDEGSFQKLVRVARDIDLKYMNPSLFAARSLSLTKLAALTDEQFDRYIGDWPSNGGINISGRRGVVWAFDESEVKGATHSFSTEGARLLIKLLGLVDLEQVRRVGLIGYHRNGTPPVYPKTPTPIDGLGHALFIWKPCDGLGGRTRDAAGGSGLREVVHASTKPSMVDWRWTKLEATDVTSKLAAK